MQVFDVLHAWHAPVLLKGAGERFEEAGTRFWFTEFGTAHGIFRGVAVMAYFGELYTHHRNSHPPIVAPAPSNVARATAGKSPEQSTPCQHPIYRAYTQLRLTRVMPPCDCLA